MPQSTSNPQQLRAPGLLGALTQTRTLPSGQQITLRCVRTQDAPLMHELLQSLSPTSRQQRFLGAIKMSDSHLRQMCRVDDPCQLALVVSLQIDHSEQLIAEARCGIDQDTGDCEFAVVVRDHWQRQGIATWALRALQDAGARAGVRHLQGFVLRDNTPQLALMQSLGFTCESDREDRRLVRVHIHLDRRLNRRIWSVPLAWRRALSWWLLPLSGRKFMLLAPSPSPLSCQLTEV